MKTPVRFIAAMLLAGLSQAGAVEKIQPIDANGLRDALASLEGRVVLVNFWATWCRPCLTEIPDLMKLAEEHADAGFELVAVSLDDAASLDGTVAPFMQKWFPEFSSYLSTERDMDDIVSVIDPYWNEVLPTSYLLARDGSMAKRIQGGSTAEEFEQELMPLLE